MNKLIQDLRLLYECNEDVSLILDIFAEIECVYREAQEASGAIYRQEPCVKNSAEVTVSFRSALSSAKLSKE